MHRSRCVPGVWGRVDVTSYRFPRVRYAHVDGVSIAYEVRGDGAIDHVRVPGSHAGVLASYLDPIVEAQSDRYATFSRLISLDRRGTGLSDPLLAGAIPPLEQRVSDVIAVMDAVGSRRAVLNAGSDGCQVAILCAAMHPDRVDALVLQNGFARFFCSDDYPFGLDPNLADAAAARCQLQWGDLDNPWALDVVAPSRRTEPGFRELLARVQQVCASPAVAAAIAVPNGDVTAVLPLVQAPTLVVYPADAAADLPGHARFLAEHIPNARLVGISGADIYFAGNTSERTDLVEEFLTGARPAPATDRVLATVLFTDIVSSTERVSELGDREWRARLDSHDAMVRTQLERFRGLEINTAGDGFFATFDGPARAVRCAQAITEAARPLGIDVRTGVHTGECEVRGRDYAGIAIHIGARVCTLAQPGEVLVTSTVRDLVAGSGITFTDRGRHALKGVPDEWTILAADP
jgi:class 3 adenylate cyclase/pimeloyl-ACP methyl ester carboxylesterase